MKFLYGKQILSKFPMEMVETTKYQQKQKFARP